MPFNSFCAPVTAPLGPLHTLAAPANQTVEPRLPQPGRSIPSGQRRIPIGQREDSLCQGNLVHWISCLGGLAASGFS
jgi:hypothetical protein